MKIAFTGSHGTGKTTASKILKKIISEEFPEANIETIGSVTRNVLNWGGKNRDSKIMLSPENNSFQLVCVYERRKMMLSKGAVEADFTISERWAVDETAYQLFKARKDTVGHDAVHTLRVCQMETQWEFDNYWDKIFYIPVDGRPVEEDGTRPNNKEYQIEIGNMFQEVVKTYIKTHKFKKMPTELEMWEPYFRKEVISWKKKK
jgi:thymidylate kinase